MNYKNASNDIEVDNDIIRRIATFALYTTAGDFTIVFPAAAAATAIIRIA